MALPNVNILWLNYNSRHIEDLVLESLESVYGLDYPSYRVIVIDNGSTDGSYETIKSFVEKRFSSRAKIVRLDKNHGFTGGMNRGFMARDKDSKYIVLLNNDAVPRSDSLRLLVEEMEKREDVGGMQGIIVDRESGLIDTAGNYMSDYIFGGIYLERESPKLMSKPIYITYASGIYSIYRIEAILKSFKGEYMFYEPLFAYCDDNVLGLKLWNNGYKIIAFPIVVAMHRRSSTFGKRSSIHLYCSMRCTSFLYHITSLDMKARLIIRTIWLRRYLTLPLFSRSFDWYYKFINAWKEGKTIAEEVKRRDGALDLYKAPIIKLRSLDIVKLITALKLVKINKNYVSKFEIES